MTIFELIALVLGLTALFSFLNYHYLKLPSTIGVMLMALASSLALIALKYAGLNLEGVVKQVFGQIAFDDALMQGMLSFLLFAGALQINLNELAHEKWTILILSTAGVVISTVITGLGLYWLLPLVGLQLDLSFCLLFGALISPTDPVAVLAILKTITVPKNMEIQIAGESLFNDGIGVIAFVILFGVATEHTDISFSHVGILFLQEAVGGAVFGLVLGWIFYLMLKSVDNYRVEVLLTIALVTGGYALSSILHVSGPIATVVSGLLIGNHGRRFAMSEQTRARLDDFWELIDEILNAILFMLIGLEVMILKFTGVWILGGLIAVGVLLMARWVSVALPVKMMSFKQKFNPGTISILTWGGLRGGIPVALALSLPEGRERTLILAITYVVVIFSITAQGLTIRRLIDWFYPAHAGARE